MNACRNPIRTGLMVGHERGQLDRMAGRRVDPKDLWTPSNATPEFVGALRAGYLKGITGETLADEDLGHG